MSRRRAAEKRSILPDAKYHDPVITKFINCLMMHGKKSAAERIVYTRWRQSGSVVVRMP
jgi:small subunit ribosomal protein S7